MIDTLTERDKAGDIAFEEQNYETTRINALAKARKTKITHYEEETDEN